MAENEDNKSKNAKGGKSAVVKNSDKGKKPDNGKKKAKPMKWYVVTIAPGFDEVLIVDEKTIAEEFAAFVESEGKGNADNVHLYELGNRMQIKSTVTISPLSTK